MHRMIARERQAGDHRLRRPSGHDRAGRHPVTHDTVVQLGVEIPVVQRDPGATVATGGRCRAKPADDIGFAPASRILQGDQETAGWRRRVSIVAAAPGVDVKHVVPGRDHVADVPEVVGEDACAKASG